jgi:hypothetical protein
MSTRKWLVAGAAGDLADVPFLDDAERAESRWLLAREVDPSAPAPSSELAADYAELEDLLGSLSSGASDERWQAEVLRIVSASAPQLQPWWRRAIFRWAMGGALAVAATFVVWIRLPRDPEPEPELEVALRHTSATRSAPDEHVVGDHLVVTARPRDAGDLRVYRADGTLVARCPNGPGCRGEAHGAQIIDIPLDAPGQYQVILVDGVSDAPPDAAMDVYLAAARAANARMIPYPPIDVH